MKSILVWLLKVLNVLSLVCGVMIGLLSFIFDITSYRGFIGFFEKIGVHDVYKAGWRVALISFLILIITSCIMRRLGE